MNKIRFWGWYSDYDNYTIDSLKKYYDVKNISMSRMVRLFLKLVTFVIPSAKKDKLVSFILKRKLNKKQVVVFSDDVLYYQGLIFHLDKPRKIVVFRNIINSAYSGRIQYLKEHGFELYTFDPTDASRYGLIFKGQYLPVYNVSADGYKEQAYFLGLDKGRAKTLSLLEVSLRKQKIKTNFIIINEREKLRRLIRRNVSYIDNVKNLLQAKYIVDIVREGQDGLTLRVLESVFYQRKLITNNKNLVTNELFDRRNMLVLDEMMTIPEGFINSEYTPLPEKTLKRYHSDNYYIDIIEKGEKFDSNN